MIITEQMIKAAHEVVPDLTSVTVRQMLVAALGKRRESLPPLAGVDLAVAEKIMAFATQHQREFAAPEVVKLGLVASHVPSLLPRMVDRGMLLMRVAEEATTRVKDRGPGKTAGDIVTRRRKLYRLPDGG